jgi:hypothetical protein
MENIFWEIEFAGTSKNDGVLWVSITFGTDVTPPGTRGTVTAVPFRRNTRFLEENP